MQDNEPTTANDEDQPEPSSSLTHDMISAYVLDALPEDERAEFERHLAGCEACQAELADLQPVVGLLPKLFEQEPDEARLARDGAAGDPDPSIRDEVLAAAPRPAEEPAPDDAAPPETPETAVAEPDEAASVPSAGEGQQAALVVDERDEAGAEATLDDLDESEPAPADEPAGDSETAERIETVETAETAETTEPEATSEAVEVTETVELDGDALEREAGAGVEPVGRLPRPKGRISPGVPTEPAPITARARRSAIPWVLAAVLLVIAALGILWALALLNRVGDLEDEVALQNQQIANLQTERDNILAQDTALISPLAPTTAGEPGAIATLYAASGGARSILAVTGMAELPDDRVYQIWLLSEEGNPEAGPTFRVDNQGGAFVPITADVLSYDAVAITEEADGGSEAPTSDPVMQTL